MLDSHVFEPENVDVVEKFEELDFSQRSDGELDTCQKYRSGVGMYLICLLTPSFSLCIMIFFKATIAPVFFDRARCTSLLARVS